MYGNYDMMGWAGGYEMIVFWILLAIVIVMLVRLYMTKSDGRLEHKETPMEILKRRYASGEIDKEEYDQKSKDLRI